MSIIEVKKVSFGYWRDEILHELSFSVAAGTFLAIAGPNGAGKSTLLNLLSGSLSPRSGSIAIDSADITSYSSRALAQKVGIVRQEFVPIFGFRVAEIVAMARMPYLDGFGFEKPADKEIIAEALELTGTAGFAWRTLGQLSGGERQRVFIARALAQDSPILLLDEPTSFLDMKHQVGIYDLLKRLQVEKMKTIVSVTHDINLAARYCERVLLLAGPVGNCRYRIGPTEEIITAEHIAEVFGIPVAECEVEGQKFIVPRVGVRRF